MPFSSTPNSSSAWRSVFVDLLAVKNAFDEDVNRFVSCNLTVLLTNHDYSATVTLSTEIGERTFSRFLRRT